MLLAWGAKVSPEFRAKLVEICGRLKVDPSHLMACIAFESAGTFSPSIVNKISGAVGLIQFMPFTALRLLKSAGYASKEGITTPVQAAAFMGKLSPVKQLSFVEQYFKPWTGRLKTFSDVYMAILWPAAVGQPENCGLFDAQNPKLALAYRQNAGLDKNKDMVVTKAEAAAHVQERLEDGLKPGNAFAM